MRKNIPSQRSRPINTRKSYTDLKEIFWWPKSACLLFCRLYNSGYFHFLSGVLFPGKKSQHVISQPSLKLTDCPHESHWHVPALHRRRSRFRTWQCTAEWHCSQSSPTIKSHCGIWTLQRAGQMTKMKSTMHVSGTRNLNGVVITSLVETALCFVQLRSAIPSLPRVIVQISIYRLIRESDYYDNH